MFLLMSFLGNMAATIFWVTELWSMVYDLTKLFESVFRFTGFIFVYVFCPTAKKFQEIKKGFRVLWLMSEEDKAAGIVQQVHKYQDTWTQFPVCQYQHSPLPVYTSSFLHTLSVKG